MKLCIISKWAQLWLKKSLEFRIEENCNLIKQNSSKNIVAIKKFGILEEYLGHKKSSCFLQKNYKF